MFQFEPIPQTQVRITDGFWSERQATNNRVALRKQYEHCRDTGRFDALRLKWKPGEKNKPHHFWDSDTAKWLEAACTSLATGNGDAGLRARIDEVAALFIGAQQPDGYINSYFTTVAPDQRWKNLRDNHELYCAGHIIEAAVAHHAATGSRDLLDAACRFADYIASVFGTEEGKVPGYCGHEEIEIALVRLHKATGNRRYLDLAAYFINQRGQQPFWFLTEHGGKMEPWPLSYFQSHMPVREQREATGHAVRAVYLYCAMTDLARESQDASLLEACRFLWRNVVDCKMYLTGGIGSERHGEAFGRNYDLPNERAYCETCASVALVMWAGRMLQNDGDAEYADVLERALHNGALCGMSLDGTKFFYENPLATDGGHHRSDWFGCACCPSNISRLIASLGGYLYSTGPSELLVHQYIGSEVEFNLAGGTRGRLRQEGGYPWAGNVKISLEVDDGAGPWELRLRMPGWTEHFAARVNGGEETPEIKNGYACFRRAWKTGDTVEIEMPMDIRRTASNPRITGNAGQIALERGPFVYCIEDADLEAGALTVALPRNEALRAREDAALLSVPVTVIEGKCIAPAAAVDDRPYHAACSDSREISFRAIPYFAWDNRTAGSMRVWIPESLA